MIVKYARQEARIVGNDVVCEAEACIDPCLTSPRFKAFRLLGAEDMVTTVGPGPGDHARPRNRDIQQCIRLALFCPYSWPPRSYSGSARAT